MAAYRLTYGATPDELNQLNYPSSNDLILGFSDNTTELKRIKLSELPYPSPVIPLQQFATANGNYSIVATDYGKIIRISNTSTVTMPLDLATGFQITIFNETNHTKTFSTTGAFLAKGTLLKTRYGAVYLTFLGSNTWLGIGDLSSV